MSELPTERLDVLARRVRWLDRYRRALSIPLGIAAWVLISREMAAMFSTDWPSVVPGVAALLFSAAAWWVVEIAFAWMLAMWETEHDRLSRVRGLPRAQLRRRPRRRVQQ